jgi:hypothetical protein
VHRRPAHKCGAPGGGPTKSSFILDWCVRSEARAGCGRDPVAGYNLTQPFFGGIITALGGKRARQAMGLNVFTLFVGFGLGNIGFGFLSPFGLAIAFAVFAGIELILGVSALPLFRSEQPARGSP